MSSGLFSLCLKHIKPAEHDAGISNAHLQNLKNPLNNFLGRVNRAVSQLPLKMAC